MTTDSIFRRRWPLRWWVRETSVAKSEVHVGLHSLSPLLVSSERRSVYRFLQVFTGQVGEADGLCLATFDPRMHDERIVNTILDPFDGLVETRESADRREARIEGLDPRPSDWTAF